MTPRDIAQRQIEAMNKAASKVWEENQSHVPHETRDEWRKLCWSHICAYYARANNGR